MMSTRISGGLAGATPQGRNPAGRPQPSPAAFDAAYQHVASPDATSPDTEAGRASGRPEQPGASPNRWIHALSAQGAAERAGRPAADGDADANGKARHSPPDDEAGHETPPVKSEAGRAAAGKADAGTDGRDAAGDTRGRQQAQDADGNKDDEKDKEKPLALAVTIQPRIETAKHAGQRNEAGTAATAAVKAKAAPAAAEATTGEPATGATGENDRPSGKSSASAAGAGVERKDAADVTARRVADSVDRPSSARTLLDARLTETDARKRIADGDGSSVSSDGKASARQRDAFQLLKPAATGSSVTAEAPGLRAGTLRARPDAANARHLPTRDIAHAGTASGGRGDGKAEGGSAKGGGRPIHAAGAAPSLPSGAAGPGGTLPPGMNVAAVANGIAARPDWTQALAAGATTASGASLAGGGVKAMVVQLNPANLGTVTATLRVSGDQLVIHLQVQTAEAYRQLSTGNDAILDRLKGHGYAVEAITVQHVAAARPDAAQLQQPQHAAFGAPQGNAGGSARGGQQMAGQGQGHQAGGQPAFAEDVSTSGGDGSGAPDPGVGRSDGVYV